MAIVKKNKTISWAWGGLNLEVRVHEKKSSKDAARDRERKKKLENHAVIVAKIEKEHPELYGKFSEPGFDVWFESVTDYKWEKRWERDYYKAEFEYEYARELDKDQNKARRQAQLRYEEENFSLLSCRQRRRIYLALSTPIWCDREKIKAIYAECKSKTLLTGIEHHVDHVIPIQGKSVCGFHIHANLEIIPAKINLAKSNKFNPWQDC